MTDFDVHPQWNAVLEDVLREASRLGAAGVVAFDLDSTLLDNRPRQAALVQRYVRERGGPPILAAFDAKHLHTGFDMREALGRQGLDAEAVERFIAEFRPYWRANFFTSEGCSEDIHVPGAPAYVRRIAAAGARVVYVTARPEFMRPGTLASLGRYRFPLPGEGVALWMNADPDASDEAFKRGTHRRLSALGTVLAAFDNEPGHANDYRTSFPDATVVLLTTGHSGRVSVLEEGIVPAPHFDFGASEDVPP